MLLAKFLFSRISLVTEDCEKLQTTNAKTLKKDKNTSVYHQARLFFQVTENSSSDFQVACGQDMHSTSSSSTSFFTAASFYLSNSPFQKSKLLTCLHKALLPEMRSSGRICGVCSVVQLFLREKF